MKVLMFGWEFPPHISGGLGTACAGLTHALEKENVDVLFTIPKLQGGEKGDRITFINASSIPIHQKRIAGSGTPGPQITAGDPSLKKYYTSKEGPRTVFEIPAFLSPYSTAHKTPPGLKHWNYSFEMIDARTIPANLRRLSSFPAAQHAGDPEEVQVKVPYAFSGSYNNVLEEMERYTQAGAEIARQHSFDLIHAHDWMTFPAAIAAKKISGKPVIVHVHATEFDRSGRQGNSKVFAIEKEGMEKADKVVTVSHWTRKIAIRHYQIDPEKIEVVHNGITPRLNASEKSFTPRVGGQIVTFLGRITYQKGPMFFVEAARRVHEQFPDAHFVVAGSGDQLPRMIERVAQVRLSSYFHFTGFLKAEDIDCIWAMSNVYVMPSVSEPFGIATLEAIQAGVPVILSKQAGVAEVMPDAIKVDFWNCEALAEAICNVLRFKSLANTLKKNGAEQIKTITWDHAAKKLTSLYYELTTNHQPEKKPDIIFSGSSTPETSHAAFF